MIPKIIHQIWIGDAPPDMILRAMESIRRKHQDFDYRLWTNGDFDLTNFDPMAPRAFIVNILRCQVLCEHGGIYIDADTHAHGSLHDFPAEFWTARLATATNPGSIYRANNALIACSPGYNFSEFIARYVPESVSVPAWNTFLTGKDVYAVPETMYGTKSWVLRDLKLGSWCTKKKETYNDVQNVHYKEEKRADKGW